MLLQTGGDHGGHDYVAGYFAPNGHYSDNPARASARRSTAHRCTAVANTTSPDGVYAYNPLSIFPTNTFNATNYFVDVIFAENLKFVSGPMSRKAVCNASCAIRLDPGGRSRRLTLRVRGIVLVA